LRNLLLNESLELAEELIEFGEGVYGASSRTEFWLRGQAVLHNKKGNRDIAVAALSRLIEDFPDSKYTTLRNELRGADSTLTMSRLSAALVDFEGVFFKKEEYLPTVKVAPVYPRRAVTRGIEGYCIVEYTVSVEGRVVNPVAVECSPTGVFEFSSIKAAEKFLYTPRVINGQPVAVPNVRNKFTYGLEH
jgi:TonB family protein